MTKIERNNAITFVKDSISSSGGWVTGYNLFSNIRASINFEISASSIDSLISNLRGLGLHPSIINDCPREADKEAHGSIALVFVHSDPEMKRDVLPFG